MQATEQHQARRLAEAQAKETTFTIHVPVRPAEAIILLMVFPPEIMHRQDQQEAQAALIRRQPEASLTIPLQRGVTRNRVQGSHTARLKEHTASLVTAHHPEVTALLREAAVVVERPALLREGRDNSSNCA